jgi:hypothetical protein
VGDIVNTLRIWIVERHSTALVLAQSADGIPNPVQPSPVLFKTWYVPSHHADRVLQCGATLIGNVVAIAGVAIGKVALAAGAGPRAVSNDLYHRIMVALSATSLVILLVPAGRRR